jgi:hypothetical protein
MTEIIKNLKNLPFGGAFPVFDPDLMSKVNDLMHAQSLSDWLNDQNIHSRFLHRYYSWIKSSSLNNLTGLDGFPILAFSNGTSESFDKFYLKNHSRRFRCFRGEYMYHAASWRNYFPGWSWLDDGPIEANDAVVISLPFSDTGNQHPETVNIVEQCNRLGVPVLIDCAYFGICQDIQFDFTPNCITDITFSLSKTFPVRHMRIGMRLTRLDDDDSLLLHHKTAYINRLGAGVGLALLNQYGPDYNCERWGATQQSFCEKMNLEPSQSVIFGLDRKNYAQYNRGGPSNRLCFSRFLYDGELPSTSTAYYELDKF